MKIVREIDGVLNEFELTNEERFKACYECTDMLMEIQIREQIREKCNNDPLIDYYEAEEELMSVIPYMIEEYMHRLRYDDLMATIVNERIDDYISELERDYDAY